MNRLLHNSLIISLFVILSLYFNHFWLVFGAIFFLEYKSREKDSKPADDQQQDKTE